jgi:galactofuranose transport system substrate-binding protein
MKKLTMVLKRSRAERRFMMKKVLVTIAVLVVIAPLLSFSAEKKLVVGFSQIGAENPWRTAMSENMKNAFAQAGITLRFSDAQGKQENQIKALRSFIAQKVDVIILAPVVATGWDAVLKEIRDKKIPLIIVNRKLTVSVGKSEDYYLTFVGPDNTQAGKMAAQFVFDTFKDKPGDINIMELQGTVGASTATERKQGFDESLKSNPRFKIIISQSGDYNRAKGKEATEAMIKAVKAQGKKIDVLWSAADDQGIGGGQALTEAGLNPGKDVIIVSVDGLKITFEEMVAGRYNATIENPIDYGPKCVELVKTIVAGKANTIPKVILVNFTLYTAATAAKELPNRKF